MGEKLVRDLSYEAHRKMYVLLAPPSTGRDWKTLADKMGYSNQEINYFACYNERAVEVLIKDYEEKKDGTISELLSLLEAMERKDLIQDLQDFIETTRTPEELERQQQAIEKIDEIRTFSESYDAFVSYAEPDLEFAKEIVKTLEEKPYCMKVCIDYRDFAPGGCYFDTVAIAIEQRCKKVVVILSENFNKCENADQQAKIALSLSPGAKKRLLIPILYKPCVVPATLRFITYLDYIREDFREYFWDKLAKSLGYVEKNDKKSSAPKKSAAAKKSAATKKSSGSKKSPFTKR